MKTLVVVLLLGACAVAHADTAFYSTLGIMGPDGARNPGVMVAIGDDTLCQVLHDEMQSTLSHAWLQRAHAFALVRNVRYPLAGSFKVHAGAFSAAGTPLVSASVYDVRRTEAGKLDLKHRVATGLVHLDAGDVLNQEALHVRLEVEFDAGGPAVPKTFVATYCPAMAALAQLWTNPG